MFRWKTRCFEFCSTENIFWLVGNEIELLWALYRKNQRFCFFLATRRCTQPCSTKKKCFGLFAVKLCVLQWYCTGKRFSFSLQRVRLIFPWFYSKQRFYLCLAKLRCSRILLLRTTFSSSFVSKLHIWRSILPEIGLLWALYHKKQRLCIFVAKRRSTQLYSTKNMFWFVWRQTGLFPALLNR